jgi:hypothetical protein
VSNVVDLLEKIGQNSRLKSLRGEQLARELSLAGLAPAVQAALVEERSRRLEELLGATSNVCCLIHAPQDQEPERDEPKDEEKMRARAVLMPYGADRRVAAKA